MGYLWMAIRVAILLGLASFATLSAGCTTPKNVKTWAQAIAEFFENQEKQTPKKQSEWRPYTLQSPAKPQTSRPEVRGKTGPNEEFKKKLTGGVTIIWVDSNSRQGTIQNLNYYDVWIEMMSLDGNKSLWKERKLLVPGKYHSFSEARVFFNIYYITGLPLETRKPPKD